MTDYPSFINMSYFISRLFVAYVASEISERELQLGRDLAADKAIL